MQIIISPAKQMKACDDFEVLGQPRFLNESKLLMTYLQALSLEELQVLWRCSDKLALENYQRIQDFSFERQLSPAVFTYVGLQFQALGADVFTQAQLNYVQKHLYILSGLYGLLRPFDGINLYRLEMQAKLKGFSSPTLYQFWADKLYRELFAPGELVLNLASKEYAKAVSPYLQAGDRFVSCRFAQRQNGKLVVKATAAKQARGDMVAYLAKVKAQGVEAVKSYQGYGYHYSEADSTASELVFVKQ